jgi:MinD-like ATPase involved in chromosome partitioning or flagellar assembly
VNLGALLAARGDRTSVVELRAALGSLAAELGVPAGRPTIPALAGAELLGDEAEVAKALYGLGPSPLFVMAAPADGWASARIRPEDMTALAATLARDHRYVILDLPSGVNDVVEEGLRRADRVVLVSSADHRTLRRAASAVPILVELGLVGGTAVVVVNSRDASVDSASSDELGGRLFGRIGAQVLRVPHAGRALAQAARSGQPVVVVEPEGAVAIALTLVARELPGGFSESAAGRTVDRRRRRAGRFFRRARLERG